MLSLGAGSAWGQSALEREYGNKAQFLKWFAIGTRWPEESFSSQNPPFVIGLFVPNNLSGPFINVLGREKINGRNVIVKVCHNLQEAQGCQLLFFSAAVDNKFGKILEQLKSASVLTVGESDAFERLGGIITFVKDQDHGVLAGYRIDRPAADRAKLAIHPTLLAKAIH